MSEALLGKISELQSTLNRVILGKSDQVELAIVCLIAKGHLLIEDLPGMGKTTLAHALAKVFGLDFRRIQFTSDLLPADITGAAIYDKSSQSFQFHPGPIFSQLILADEINRATPKTQSALLEAMEENQVTVEGETRSLPQPFFVIGTQNPSHQVGTYPLPESQLDRFLIRLTLGYPHPDVEQQLLSQGDHRATALAVEPILSHIELSKIQHLVSSVEIKKFALDYVTELIGSTRSSEDLNHGLSPRGGLALVQAAKAVAWLSQRNYITPEDIQKVFVEVVGHRLQTDQRSSLSGVQVAQKILQAVSVPI